MAVSRHSQLSEDMAAWVKQFRPDIKLHIYNSKKYTAPQVGEYTVDVYGLGVRECNWTRAQKNLTLWTKAEIRKGVTILTCAEHGKRWHRPVRTKPFEEIVPKRRLSQASLLKNRYRRALITIPRQIQNLESKVAEFRLEEPIVREEANRLYNNAQNLHDAFEARWKISLKPYPYFQSITRYAIKLGATRYGQMREELWALRDLNQRHDDLERRVRELHRYIRSADEKIAKAKAKQAKLGHGQDPNKKRSWEK